MQTVIIKVLGMRTEPPASYASFFRVFRPPPLQRRNFRSTQIDFANIRRESLIPLSINNSTFKGFVNDNFFQYFAHFLVD